MTIGMEAHQEGDVQATAPDAPVTVHPLAATVVLLRDSPAGPEVLLLERPTDRGSFAGAWVFPGGRAEPEDALVEGMELDEEEAARHAGVRETFEETGLEVPYDSLVTSARWTPPPSIERRFLTWFFYAPAPAGDIVLSPGESIDYRWVRPAEALELHAAGQLSLVPPTWMTLNAMTGDASVQEAIERVRRITRQDFATHRATSSRGPCCSGRATWRMPMRRSWTRTGPATGSRPRCCRGCTCGPMGGVAELGSVSVSVCSLSDLLDQLGARRSTPRAPS